MNFSGPNLPQLWLFHQYFVCKSSFRVISMLKMVILDQSKPIYLIFEEKKIKISKIQNLYKARLLFIKNGYKTSIQPILKSNSTSFMFNKNICEVKGKKVIHCWWNGGPVLISSWRCNFSIYLDIQVYYLDIQAITTLLCLILLLMCCFLLLIKFSMLLPLS